MKDTIRFPKGAVKMIAHRGLSGIEQQNTCAAFLAAANRDYYGIETDVRPTADGKIVVLHDADTSHVSDTVLTVAEHTFEEVRAVQLRDKEGVTRPYLQIPTPEEYIAICARYGKIGVMELKGYFTKEMLAGILETVRALYSLEGMTFISFEYASLVNLRELEPTAMLQYLVGASPVDDALIEKLKKYSFDLDIHYSALTKEAVDLLHENGIVVNCWTVDDPVKAAELAAWGVDQITSNILQ